MHSFKGRWVVDGSGRTGLLRRKLGLSRPASHNANAVWFRMGRRIKIDDWSGQRVVAVLDADARSGG